MAGPLTRGHPHPHPTLRCQCGRKMFWWGGGVTVCAWCEVIGWWPTYLELIGESP